MSDSSSEVSSESSSPEKCTGRTPSNTTELNRRQLFKSTPLSDKINELILEEVRKTNSSIAEFSTRIDAMESRLKTVEQQQNDMTTPSSSGDSSVERAKKKIPTRVRVSAYSSSRFKYIPHNVTVM